MNTFKRFYRGAPVTAGLIFIIVIVYLYTILRFGPDMTAIQALEVGAYMPASIYLEHEYYRFFTANFLHFGLLHLICNSLSLYNVGPFMERIYGRWKYIVVLLSSALGTTILPYLFEIVLMGRFERNFITVSGGASGMILGLLGALLFLAYYYRGIYQRAFRSILPSLLLVLFISFTVPSVSLSGHIGGFVGGFLGAFGLMLFNRYQTYKKNRQQMWN